MSQENDPVVDIKTTQWVDIKLLALISIFEQSNPVDYNQRYAYDNNWITWIH